MREQLYPHWTQERPLTWSQCATPYSQRIGSATIKQTGGGKVEEVVEESNQGMGVFREL